jgi:hypothetical protein
MSDTVTFAEIDGQYVELLPARTVLSTFSMGEVGGPNGGGNGIVADPNYVRTIVVIAGDHGTGGSSGGGGGGNSE